MLPAVALAAVKYSLDTRNHLYRWVSEMLGGRCIEFFFIFSQLAFKMSPSRSGILMK